MTNTRYMITTTARIRNIREERAACCTTSFKNKVSEPLHFRGAVDSENHTATPLIHLRTTGRIAI